MVGGLVEKCIQCWAQWTVVPSSIGNKKIIRESFPEEPWRVWRTFLTEKAARARARRHTHRAVFRDWLEGRWGWRKGAWWSLHDAKGRDEQGGWARFWGDLSALLRNSGFLTFSFLKNNQAYIVFLHRYISVHSLFSNLLLSGPASNASTSLYLTPSGNKS